MRSVASVQDERIHEPAPIFLIIKDGRRRLMPIVTFGAMTRTLQTLKYSHLCPSLIPSLFHLLLYLWTYPRIINRDARVTYQTPWTSLGMAYTVRVLALIIQTFLIDEILVRFIKTQHALGGLCLYVPSCCPSVGSQQCLLDGSLERISTTIGGC